MNCIKIILFSSLCVNANFIACTYLLSDDYKTKSASIMILIAWINVCGGWGRLQEVA